MQFDEIIKLIHTVSDSNLESFAIEQGDFKLNLVNREKTISSKEISTFVVANERASENLQEIVSPLVGTFYAAKAEGEQPFVSVGEEIKEGQVVGIIEAMKLMNEVISTVNGIVEEILIENEQTVEYGQVLIRVRAN